MRSWVGTIVWGGFHLWSAGCGGEVGTDHAAELEDLRAYVMAPEMNTQALLVFRGGEPEAAWYAPGRSRTDLATSWSIAKSFTSTLVGIALGEGLLPSLDEPLANTLEEWSGQDRGQITIRHALAMSTGLDWLESEQTPRDIIGLALSKDQLAYAMSARAIHPPGTVFNYSSGNSMLLSQVLERATGMRLIEYMRRRLLEPLGIRDFEWWEDGAGHTLGYCCIDATPEDFAKLGLLYAADGMYAGQRILPSGWVALATSPGSSPTPGYGLSFRNNADRSQDDPEWERNFQNVSRTLYYALGHDNQFIAVLPEHDLVVVRFALFERPNGPAVAQDGLWSAGMMLGGLTPTGTRPPGPEWSDEKFFELVEALGDP